MKLITILLLFTVFTITLCESSMNLNYIMNTASSKKKRYTKDGRKCALAFKQDGVTYTDCTSAKTPDGQIPKEEWCYIDNPEKGTKTWEYCIPVMDWDKVRSKTQDMLNDFVMEIRGSKSTVNKGMIPGNEMIRKVKQIEEETSEIDRKVSELDEIEGVIKNNMNALTDAKIQWELLEEQCVTLQSKLSENNNKNKRENIDRTKGERSIITKKNYGQNIKTKINEKIKQSNEQIQQTMNVGQNDYGEKEIDESNCEGYDNYQSETEGLGLNGYYYSSSSFEGVPSLQIDSLINYDNIVPPDGIKEDSFSIKWTGYIKAPISNDYIFIIETNSNVSLVLSSDIIIKSSASLSESKPIHLNGSQKYKVTLTYSFNGHLSKSSHNKKTLKLYWKTNTFEQTIINTKYLFPSMIKEPIKSSIDSSIGNIKRLYENDFAFKDTNEYILQDIPDEYKGLQTIQLNFNNNNDIIEFETNENNIVLYVATISTSPLLFKEELLATNDFLSLLKINRNDLSRGNIESEESYLMSISRRSISKGKNTLTIQNRSNEKIDNAIVLFLGYDNSLHLQCGGDVIKISDPHSKAFKSCNSSSGRCKDAFISRKFWSSHNEGIGASLSVEFNQRYEISRIEFIDKINPSERNSELSLIFDENIERTIETKNTNDKQIFLIEPPVIAKQIKIMISKVYGTINNGGHFDIYGSLCSIQTEEEDTSIDIFQISKEMKPLFPTAQKDSFISLSCRDSLINTNKINIKDFIENKSMMIYCQEGCSNSQFNIYGDIRYSLDSSICKAAYHSGVIQNGGGFFILQYNDSPMIITSSKRNQIESLSKRNKQEYMSFDKLNNIPQKQRVSNEKIRIKFAPKNYKNVNIEESPNKYVIDNGNRFGFNNRPYGWSSDISSRTKIVRNGNNIIEDSLIEMIPNKKCVWCSKMNCEDTVFGVYVGEGKYLVKIFVNDKEGNTIENIVINGKRAASSVFVPKGKTMLFSNEVETDEKGLIIISSECETNCEYAVSKINIIEIIKNN